MQAFSPLSFLHMEFPEHLTAQLKERDLTQQALVDVTGFHGWQIRRYEGGNSQPTLYAVRTMLETLIVRSQVTGMLEGVGKRA